MKLKHILIITAIVAALVVGLWSCQQTAKYKALKAEYTEFRKIVEADNVFSNEKIAQLTAGIMVSNENTKKLEGELSSKSLQLAVVSKRLDELQHAEPVQPELEKEPLVINLRGQISKLTKMFNLSQASVATQQKIIDELNGKYVVQVGISNEYKSQYEGEHKLRLKAEGVISAGEKRGVIVNLFGLKLDIIKDVIVPSGTFALGYALGSKR